MIKITSNPASPLRNAIFPLSNLLLICFLGCPTEASAGQILETIKKNNQLIVLTRSAPSIYLESDKGPRGFEYELTQKLAKELNVEVLYKTYPTEKALFEAIENGEGHIAAAGISKTQEREEEFEFGPSYQTIRQQIVCNRENKSPKNLFELSKTKLLIAEHSNYEERLVELKNRYPNLEWESDSELTSEAVLKKVSKGEADCTIADSNILQLVKKSYPNLKVAFSLNKAQELAWILPQQDEKLSAYVSNWFENQTENSKADTIDEQYYNPLHHLNEANEKSRNQPEILKLDSQAKLMDRKEFSGLVSARFANYHELFKSAADKYDVPWALIAAQAYQESSWNPNAVGPAGVKGMMMLAQETARSLNVSNRMDARQSIEGGAKYMLRLLRELSPDIPDSERVNFALAAYNAGIGTLHNVRALARKMGKNPNSWAGVKEAFSSRYGRKSSPVVNYVERVLKYKHTLERLASNKG